MSDPNNQADPFDLASGVPVSMVGAGIEGELRPKPRASAGLSRKVVFFLGGFGVLLLLVFMAAMEEVGEKPASPKPDKKKEAEQKTTVAGVPQDLKSDKKGPVLPSVSPEPPEEAAKPPVTTVPKLGGTSVLGKDGGQPGGAPGNLSPEEQRAQMVRQKREDRLLQAKYNGLEVKPYGGGGASDGAAPSGGSKGGVDKQAAGKAATPLSLFGGTGSGGGYGSMDSAGGGEGSAAAGDQDQKLKFIQAGGTAPAGYHGSTLMPPLSMAQLNAGAFVPAVLEMAINSDLPGLVKARVRENVYASVRDECLLIPSSATLVGSYDSKVAIGQARQLVVWNRIVYPNGHELNLAGMPTVDSSGQTGLEADVDNHWLRLFGVALGMSAVTATVQLSVQPSTTTTTNSSSVTSQQTNAQVVSTALAQQYGQLGGQLMGKYLNVQPTLRNYPGERFNVLVPKNIVFPDCYRG